MTDRDDIKLSVESIASSLDALADLEVESLATDREETGGFLCYDPETNRAEVKNVRSSNDASVNSPSLTIGELAKVCPEGTTATFWHTHGAMLHTFSDFDRYSAGDLIATGKKIGVCSLGIDEVQCHYAYFSVPQVVNIKWGDKLRDRLKPLAVQVIIADDLMCDAKLNCSARHWSKGMKRVPIGAFDQVNALDEVVSSFSSDGEMLTSHYGLECFEIKSTDGFRSLNCFSRRKEYEKEGFK